MFKPFVKEENQIVKRLSEKYSHSHENDDDVS